MSECDSLKTSDLESVPQMFPNLKTLRLVELPLQPSLIDEYLSDKLEKLTLRTCNNLNQEQLIALAKKCTNLKGLQFSNCYSMTNEILSQLFLNPQLEILQIIMAPSIGDKGIPFFQDKHLKKLTLSWCNGITDVSLTALLEQPLQHLDLSYTKFSDDFVAQLIETLPDLTHLSLSGCKNIGNKTLEKIGQCSKLEVLNLEDCSKIGKGLSSSDLIFKNLAKLKNLRELKIENTRITSKVIVNLATSLSQLEIFSFCFDQCFRTMFPRIFKALPRLKSLAISLRKDVHGHSKGWYQDKVLEDYIPFLKNLVHLRLQCPVESQIPQLLTSNVRLQRIIAGNVHYNGDELQTKRISMASRLKSNA